MSINPFKKRKVDSEEDTTTGPPPYLSSGGASSPHLSLNYHSLASKLVDVSEQYPEIKEFDEFNRLVAKIRSKCRQSDNERNCSFYALPKDVMSKCFSFVGNKSYGFLAPVSKYFNKVYTETFNGDTETSTDFRRLSKDAALYLIYSFPNYIVGYTRDSIRTVCYSDVHLFQRISEQGNLDLFRHMLDNGYDLLKGQDMEFTLYQKIAENGHLHILEYLAEEHYFLHGLTCSSYGATLGGHIHILKWLESKDVFSQHCDVEVVNRCIEIALSKGFLEILEWFPYLDIDAEKDYPMSYALKSKCINTVVFSHRRHGLYTSKVTEQSVIATGNLEIVKYLKNNGFEMTSKSTKYASENGYKEILSWLVSQGFPYPYDVTPNPHDTTTFEQAKRGFQRDRHWSNVTICKCILGEKRNFSLGMLKYLHNKSCPWGEEGLLNLVKLKRMEFLNYIRCQSRISGKGRMMQYVIHAKWFDGIQFVFNKMRNRKGYRDPSLSYVAEHYCELKVLKYCKSRGMFWNIDEYKVIPLAITQSAIKQDFETMKWLYLERGNILPGTFNMTELLLANFGFRKDVLDFLREIERLSSKTALDLAMKQGADAESSLKLLHDCGCLSSESTLSLETIVDLAIEHRVGIESLKLLHDCGCLSSAKVVEIAIKQSMGVESLKILHEWGYKFNANTFEIVLQRFSDRRDDKNRTMLAFLISIKCPQYNYQSDRSPRDSIMQFTPLIQSMDDYFKERGVVV